MSYNLSDNVNESFEFFLVSNGKEIHYRMQYPLVEDIEKMQELIAKSEDKDKKSGEGNKELNEWMYSFITPVDEASPPIAETLKTVNVKVMQNFNAMFKTEFGIE